jgi:ABC-type glycerol-3-phosphate transport system permease component
LLATMMIPYTVTMIPLYKTWHALYSPYSAAFRGTCLLYNHHASVHEGDSPFVV